MKIKNIFFIFLLSITHLQAIEENQFNEIYHSQVLPYYQSFEKGNFQSIEGVPISYIKKELEQENGALIFVLGYGESYIKYAEVMYDLQDLQLSYYAYDHCGMGFSGRLLEDPVKTYINSFESYVTDLNTFITDIVQSKKHKKLFLIAHSMGGGVATLFLAENPELIDGAILSAPMHKVKMPIPENISLFITSLAEKWGKGKEYALGQNGKINPVDFEQQNTCSHSKERFYLWKKNIMREKYPQIYIGGGTNNWIKELIIATKRIRQNGDQIQTPFILLQAGQDDWVDNQGHLQVLSKTNFGKLITLPGARHDILLEKDEIRDKALQSIKNFIQSQLEK
ncbi:MAG: alpha/beta fold hydrolase [Spirochaetes bacterium]|nr:alpha/beta fold hydrolase [Spirochaetota bacterium]